MIRMINRPITLALAGRTDLEDFFNLSGIRTHSKLNHTPALVFIVSGNSVKVRAITKPKLLLEYPDDTQVMMQWSGKWRSDFFQFTIGQLKEHIARVPPSSHHQF